jgi:hypothetical protein
VFLGADLGLFEGWIGLWNRVELGVYLRYKFEEELEGGDKGSGWETFLGWIQGSQKTIYQGGRHNCKDPKHETHMAMDKIDSDPPGTRNVLEWFKNLKVGYFLWL